VAQRLRRNMRVLQRALRAMGPVVEGWAESEVCRQAEAQPCQPPR
jgi:hypothetical protein